MMTLCTGSLETEILPLLTSSVFATEVCIMFYIEKIGKQVVYRSRNCPLVLPKYTKYNKCHNCQELLDYLSHLHEQIKEIVLLFFLNIPNTTNATIAKNCWTI